MGKRKPGKVYLCVLLSAAAGAAKSREGEEQWPLSAGKSRHCDRFIYPKSKIGMLMPSAACSQQDSMPRCIGD